MARQCSWCGESGHNRRTCKDLTYYYRRHGITKQVQQRDKSNPDRVKKPRRCGFCGVHGHNRRTSPEIPAWKKRQVALAASWRQQLYEAMLKHGFGVGSLVVMDCWARWPDKNGKLSWGFKECPAIVTSIKWNNLHHLSKRNHSSNNYHMTIRFVRDLKEESAYLPWSLHYGYGGAPTDMLSKVDVAKTTGRCMPEGWLEGKHMSLKVPACGPRNDS